MKIYSDKDGNYPNLLSGMRVVNGNYECVANEDGTISPSVYRSVKMYYMCDVLPDVVQRFGANDYNSILDEYKKNGTVWTIATLLAKPTKKCQCDSHVIFLRGCQCGGE